MLWKQNRLKLLATTYFFSTSINRIVIHRQSAAISSAFARGVKSLQVDLGNQQIGTRRPVKMAHSNGGNKLSQTEDNEQVIPSALKPETNDNIVWIDCEMTGLDLSTDRILEVACIITDADLKEISRHSNIVIHVGEEVLSKMGAWCVHHHNESGLTADSRKSSVTLSEAEDTLIEFVKKYSDAGKCPIGGNSVYMDRMFLQKYMPRLYNHFHYRSIDVTCVKELCRRWFPNAYYTAPKKRFVHRTIEDIEDTIQELKFYRESIFKRLN